MADIEPHYLGGEGEPLVLLHGITGTWQIWEPVLEALAQRHALYVPTLPGHWGGPALAAADGGMPAMADELEEMLDEQGLKTAHIAGNSLGGWLSLELARRGRARSVTALSPAGQWRNAADVRRVVTMLSATSWLIAHQGERVQQVIRRPGLRKLSMRSTMEHGERVPLPAAVSMLQGVAETTAFTPFMKWVKTADPAQGDGIDVPLRIAWGEKDQILPFKRYGAPMLAAVPQAEHVTLHGCGHVPMYDDPDLVARTILEVSAA